MSDYLVRLAGKPMARRILKSLGLPTPLRLARAKGPYVEQPLEGKNVILDEAGTGLVFESLRDALGQAGARPERRPQALAANQRVDAVVLDATGVAKVEDLNGLYDTLHEALPRLGTFGRILVLTGMPEEAERPAQAAAHRAVEGFVRSLAKEIGKRGATANAAYVGKDAGSRLDALLRFALTERSVYVDGQAFSVSSAVAAPRKLPLTQVLAGKKAVVTGSARGIGAATAARLAAEGAHVICVDVPDAESLLAETARPFGGSTLGLSISDPKAPATLSAFLKEKFGGVDIVVHNAGITRDKTLAKMKKQAWEQTLDVNLASILRMDERLVADGVLRDEGRVVCMSSMAGIAGNLGQTNYAASKAGLIGYVRSEARRHAGRGITINAVAPGFIETRMTATIPFVVREAGRRLNSMSQGGQPEDVAELVTFLASPGAYGLTGNVIRVCGQSLLGA